MTHRLVQPTQRQTRPRLPYTCSAVAIVPVELSLPFVAVTSEGPREKQRKEKKMVYSTYKQQRILFFYCKWQNAKASAPLVPYAMYFVNYSERLQVSYDCGADEGRRACC